MGRIQNRGCLHPGCVETQSRRRVGFYSARRDAGQKAQPNSAHLALAELESSLPGRFFLCTQNVDDLHERAGSVNLIHMHGELAKSRCENDAELPPSKTAPSMQISWTRWAAAPAVAAFARISFSSARFLLRWIAFRRARQGDARWSSSAPPAPSTRQPTSSIGPPRRRAHGVYRPRAPAQRLRIYPRSGWQSGC